MVIKHILAILISVFSDGFYGKPQDFSENSPGRDDTKLEDAIKASVLCIIYEEATRFGKPVFCIADDTISSKT